MFQFSVKKYVKTCDVGCLRVTRENLNKSYFDGVGNVNETVWVYVSRNKAGDVRRCLCITYNIAVPLDADTPTRLVRLLGWRVVDFNLLDTVPGLEGERESRL